MTDGPSADPTASGRRERATPPGRETASLAPAASQPQPDFAVTGYGVMFYVHKAVRARGLAYVTACGVVGMDLPDRVRPDSRWLIPCETCFPDGSVGGPHN